MPNATAGKGSSKKEAKSAKKVAFPSGWTVTEHEDGKLSAVRRFSTSELTAYGVDEQELLAAIEDYEDKIARGLITPR